MRSLLIALAAEAADSFDPTAYLRTQAASAPAAPASTSALQEAEVTVKGVPYHVVRSPYGTLYLPRLDHFTRADVDRALCANQLPYQLEKCEPTDASCQQRNHDRVTETVAVVHAETPLSGTLVAYADLLADTIRVRCGDVPDEYYPASPRLAPEIGVSWKGGSERQPTTYKIFNNLKRGLGFRSEF